MHYSKLLHTAVLTPSLYKRCKKKPVALEDLADSSCKANRTFQALLQPLQHLDAPAFSFSLELTMLFHFHHCNSQSVSPAGWCRAKSQAGQSLADEALHPRSWIWDGTTLVWNLHRSIQAGLRCVLPVGHLHLACDRDLGHVVVLLVKEGAGDHDLRHKRSHFILLIVRVSLNGYQFKIELCIFSVPKRKC